MVTDEVWKLPNIVNRYLSSRVAIPLAQEQIGIMISILKTGESIEKFLDLGCGDGILGASILAEYPNSQGVLVDFSEPMLEQARSQLQDFSNQFVLENLDYGDPTWVNKMQAYAPFDAIVSGYSIHHQPDNRKKEIYQEIFSLLKPNGWFVNIEHIAAESQLAVDLFNNHIVEQWYEKEKATGSSKTKQEVRDAFMNRPDKDSNILLSVNTQCDWLREIGYQQVDCYFRIYELAVFAGQKPNHKSN